MADFLADLLSKKKNPQELISSIQKHLAHISDKNVATEEYKQSMEKLTKNLAAVKLTLIGDVSNESKPENVAKMLVELNTPDFLVSILRLLNKLEFEARKDYATSVAFAIKKGDFGSLMQHNQNLISLLVNGYEDSEIALHCGVILREMIKHETLCKQIVENADWFYRFFDFVQNANFDVASDAFDTLKSLLTRHKVLMARFFEQNYERVFGKYNELVNSENYVTKRQSIKLLGEILLDRTNFNIMMRYIGDPENLKLMMNLLRAASKTIQFETFHVFKVFVANPNKTEPVLEILLANKSKLIDFLQKFKSEKDVAQFNEEKNILLQTLESLC